MKQVNEIMSKWEYKILTQPETQNPQSIERFEKLINEYAEEGWEPLNITSEGAYQREPRLFCLIRRAKGRRD
ncbi:hypothetical protein CEE45_04790 [Candidatus Heimdallarchaeota archaeon B3_Heim]|nr:MAG: hypothetical protein CEE45_04790 [Candidatus Heimdallarchaeota archaeon B3_Heim]